MLPGFAFDDVADCARRHAVLFGNGSLNRAILNRSSDFHYLFGSKFGTCVLFTGTAASFFDAIMDIVRQCSEEQMVRPDAESIVASVKHGKWKWIYSMVNGIGHSMRIVREISANAYLAVSARTSGRSPSPAIRAFFHTAPELIQNSLCDFREWFSRSLCHFGLLVRSKIGTAHGCEPCAVPAS